MLRAVRIFCNFDVSFIPLPLTGDFDSASQSINQSLRLLASDQWSIHNTKVKKKKINGKKIRSQYNRLYGSSWYIEC